MDSAYLTPCNYDDDMQASCKRNDRNTCATAPSPICVARQASSVTAIASRRGRRALPPPPPRLPLSISIETNVRLADGQSHPPSPLRLWAFQQLIADSIAELAIERVTLCKCVHAGFSIENNARPLNQRFSYETCSSL